MKLTLGDKIKELRKRDGRKQEELANALGVTNQAVSRWENDGSYPDIEMIPAIANYFGITIDELFGYDNDREKKIDTIVAKIKEMNYRNNGVDINIDECIALAREAMIEFPGNAEIMLCLADVLYNAGYVRYGEHHLIDAEGYNVYDVDRHRKYAEWKEAITIYEKLLKTLEPGEMRNNVLNNLTQLYRNLGEHERALSAIEAAPTIYGSYEFLRINTLDGKHRAEASGEALLKTINACAELIIGTMISYEQNMTPTEKVQSIKSAITLFDHVCTDGFYGIYHAHIARMYNLLSLYLWLDGKHDEAFEALDKSLFHFRAFEELCSKSEATYTAPLLRLVDTDIKRWRFNKTYPHTEAISLAEDWPWWSVREYSLVKDEIQSDPRWQAWIAKLQS
ncbi:MAG: helix-turn-helix transcriptional regulator [Oscillospiraceae bacterium]|nr:helix-turn-helix transcriptional regulator [Oscillospiraceae bacterium]